MHNKVDYFKGFTLQADIYLVAVGKPSQHAHKYTEETAWDAGLGVKHALRDYRRQEALGSKQWPLYQ